ncbi:AraC family transcriptional regulator [Metabacillus bambusae]|uniref:AraC family transcriptional regulator n=1 Tax=Metabacillus bambusae TaxID=2795218 RepID=A0ABS3N9Q9_9BACI|nr:AraC family transcriptional regulator [Metabacillus bambusae]MBO1515016.1 AraC family transcriptional regulator [Metabacillus bambusae]
MKKHFLIPLNESKLPLFAETIGFNPAQENITRPSGYPYYHWIQTVSGQGSIMFQNQQINLTTNNGVLLLPHMAHSYKNEQNDATSWKTLYVTFGGIMVKEILITLGLYQSAFFHWEQEAPISTFLTKVLKQSDETTDSFSISASSDVYEFLLLLKKYGKTNKSSLKETNNLVTLYSLIDWMKSHLSNPDVGLDEMALFINTSKRHLNSLFQKNFHVTPYAYFVNLRIQQAKKILLENNSATIGDIALQVGFRSTSHFVATFRKMVGIPPEKYRHLNGVF